MHRLAACSKFQSALPATPIAVVRGLGITLPGGAGGALAGLRGVPPLISAADAALPAPAAGPLTKQHCSSFLCVLLAIAAHLPHQAACKDGDLQRAVTAVGCKLALLPRLYRSRPAVVWATLPLNSWRQTYNYLLCILRLATGVLLGA